MAIRDARVLQLESDGGVRSSDGRLRAVLERHGLNRGVALHSPRSAAPGTGRLLLRSARGDFDPYEAARELAATGAFRAVAPNLKLELFATTPNDPNLFLQWHVTTASNVDAQLTEGWDLGKGDTSTVIAVIDNGFDIHHEDLAGNVWINRSEIPANGLDDDGNGYTDDVRGWDFGNHDNSPMAEPMPDDSGVDIGFHGSGVAGVAAAVTNNAVGMAGAAWSCRFMALKVGNTAGDITLEAFTEAFAYALDEGADVINVSLGTPDTTARAFLQALADDAGLADVLVVAGAGNSGSDVKSFPAACDGVLAVGATTDANTRASFSNWGTWVDIAAPGELIWTAINDNYTFDFLTQLILILSGWDGETPYVYQDGTSFASPLVAGIAGLVRSKHPGLSAAEVADHLVQTGDVVAYDHPIGRRVNAFRALGEPVLGVGPGPAANLGLEAAWPNPFTHQTTLRFSLSKSGPVTVRIHDVNGRLVRELVRAWLPAGQHSALWDGRAGSGATLVSGIYFASLQTSDGRAVRKLILAR